MKRRAWNSTLPAPSKPMLRSGRLKAKRAKARRGACVPNKGLRSFAKAHGCLIRSSRCSSVLDFAHVVSRGAGGKDEGNGLCLCRAHHQEQHRIGVRSFEQRYGVDLAGEAARLWDDYARSGCPEKEHNR